MHQTMLAISRRAGQFLIVRSMLGVNSPREPITPEFSREIRAALRRAMTGNLNDREKEARRRLKESEKYWTMEWKGIHF